MSKDKKEKKRKKRMKKVIAYIIAAILIIAFNVLYLSRYFLGVYINYKRNDWETKQKVLEAEKKRKEEELRRKEQEMKEQQETQAVEPFEFDFDPIPVPEPISRKVSSSSTPIQKNRKSSINNSSVQNYPYPLNREIHKPVMKTLNIKIRGEESVIRDIMKYIYDKKDIEILQ